MIDATQTTLYPGGILNTGFAVNWAKERVHDALPASASGGRSKVHSSYRLFMAPGMAHCGGGEGPNDFDELTADLVPIIPILWLLVIGAVQALAGLAVYMERFRVN